jgi:hypothetical protein
VCSLPSVGECACGHHDATCRCRVRTLEKVPTKNLPCSPLEAHLSPLITQYSVEADLRAFCIFDIAPRRITIQYPKSCGPPAALVGAIGHPPLSKGRRYAGCWIWTSENASSRNCLIKSSGGVWIVCLWWPKLPKKGFFTRSCWLRGSSLWPILIYQTVSLGTWMKKGINVSALERGERWWSLCLPE